MIDVVCPFVLVSYSPVYLAADRTDVLRIRTLDGVLGQEGPARLAAGEGQALLGGPIRLIKQILDEGRSELRMVAQVTSSCPFYVVAAPSSASPQRWNDLDRIYTFPLTDAPEQCLLAGTGRSPLEPLSPTTDVSPSALLESLRAEPTAGFLAPGDTALLLAHQGNAEVVLAVPDVLSGIPFSAIEVLADAAIDDDVLLDVRAAITTELRRLHELPVGQLAEELGPWFPAIPIEVLAAILTRYRADGIWPTTARPDLGQTRAFAEALHGIDFVRDPGDTAFDALIAP